MSYSKFGKDGSIGESSCLFLKASLFDEIAGFEEAFKMQGREVTNLSIKIRKLRLQE